jgi:hypothetical protein
MTAFLNVEVPRARVASASPRKAPRSTIWTRRLITPETRPMCPGRTDDPGPEFPPG